MEQVLGVVDALPGGAPLLEGDCTSSSTTGDEVAAILGHIAGTGGEYRYGGSVAAVGVLHGGRRAGKVKFRSGGYTVISGDGLGARDGFTPHGRVDVTAVGDQVAFYIVHSD